ncbi:MAG: class I SAM-dependent methyltransferase [Pseudomonadota bacterium]
MARANIAPGSRGLDIGCGTGDVTFRLAAAVGPKGHVVGIDPNPAALNTARQSARNTGLVHVAFEETDLFAIAEAGAPFDVITCRRVLMYLPDQGAAARALKRLLRPGGLLVIQEHDATLRHSTAPVPLYDQARDWVWDTVAAEGANVATGFDLYDLLATAGFSDIDISAEAIVETPQQASPLPGIIEAMIPRIEAAGIARPEDIDIETLAERLAAERQNCGATTVSELIFGAIARVA